jgi:GrpB-like predicted nucleotidyltransferase (UPF0157 family)
MSWEKSSYRTLWEHRCLWLAGKGVVDILIGFQSKAQLLAAVQKLVAASYFLSKKRQRARGDRIFLSSRKNKSMIGDVHLHLVLEASDDFKKVLRFRNRLRRNKALRGRYLKLKKKALRLPKESANTIPISNRNS